MKKYLVLLLALSAYLTCNAQETNTSKRISGIVFNNGAPLPNVTVKVVDSEEEVLTDKNGRYDILVDIGNEVTFDYPGMQQVRKKVLADTFSLNATLSLKVQELDNVTVTKEKALKKTQEELFDDYETNKGAIKTSFGILDKNTSGVSLSVVDGSQLSLASGNLVDAIANQFSGVSVRGSGAATGNPNDRSLFMRGGGSVLNATPAIFEVDGNIYTDVPIFLDISNIKRIAKMAGLAATARYGSIAQGGIFIINTKSANFSRKGGKIVDRALVKNNDYEGDALPQGQIRKNWPEYLKQLYASTSFKDAKEHFETNASKYGNAVHYFVDGYTYFAKNWSNENYGEIILEKSASKFEDNPVWLKAFAYLLQRDKNYESAVSLYKKVFLKRSNYSQSYRDLANSYLEAGQVQKAANLYARYNKLLKDEFLQVEEEGAHPIINREFNTFILQNGGSFMSKEDMREAKEEVVDEGVRLVFEWNDDQADFELQFVNPQKKFFKWSTPYDPQMASQANAAPKSSIVDYFIDDSMPGNWQVNIKYRGNVSGAPIYLKVTTYFNYGEKNQREKTEVFRVALKNANQKLFDFNGSSFMVSE